MVKLWSSMAKRAMPYIPGEQLNRADTVKLNTNENPYPPSPSVVEAIRGETGDALRLYPSPTADRLRSTIADYYGVKDDEVFVGNGSDEVIAFSFMAFFEPGRTIRIPDITYSFYPVYAKLFNIPYEAVPLNEDFTLPIESFYQSEGGVIFPNPNAPTSLYIDLKYIEHIVEENRGRVVVIDEAYIDFAGASAVGLIRKYNNLLVVQTMSKSRSLAGMRVGFAIGHPSLMEALTRVKDSFNSYPIDRLAMVAAEASFKDQVYFEKTRRAILVTREQAKKRLTELGFDVLPSQTNFLFATHLTADAEELSVRLKNDGILVRHFNSPRIERYLRITVGTNDQMAILYERLQLHLKNIGALSVQKLL